VLPARSALLTPRRSVDLIESVEHRLELAGRNAHPAVGYGEMNLERRLEIALHSGANDNAAVRRELHSVAHEIYEHLPQPLPVADHHQRDLVREIAQQVQPFLVRPRARRMCHRLDDVVDETRIGRECHLPGFDLREIKNLVDQVQQPLGVTLERLEELALIGALRPFEREIRGAENRIHRRADLMTHHGEKIALRAVGRFGLGARFLELGEATIRLRH
jgi:hypothetical protein